MQGIQLPPLLRQVVKPEFADRRPYVCRITICARRCPMRTDDLAFSSDFENPIQLINEMNSLCGGQVLKEVTSPRLFHTIVFKRPPIVAEIDDIIDADKPLAINADKALF